MALDPASLLIGIGVGIFSAFCVRVVDFCITKLKG